MKIQINKEFSLIFFQFLLFRLFSDLRVYDLPITQQYRRRVQVSIECPCLARRQTRILEKEQEQAEQKHIHQKSCV